MVNGFMGIMIDLTIAGLNYIRKAEWFSKLCGEFSTLACHIIDLAVNALLVLRGKQTWSNIMDKFFDKDRQLTLHNRYEQNRRV